MTSGKKKSGHSFRKDVTVDSTSNQKYVFKKIAGMFEVWWILVSQPENTMLTQGKFK